MDIFLKTIGGILLCAILCLGIPQQSKQIVTVIVIAVCCMTGMIAFQFLEPLVDFWDQLVTTGNLNGDMMSVLLKVVGISLVSEFAAVVCEQGGNGALGKAIHFITAAILLSLCIPFM